MFVAIQSAGPLVCIDAVPGKQQPCASLLGLASSIHDNRFEARLRVAHTLVEKTTELREPSEEVRSGRAGRLDFDCSEAGPAFDQ